MISIDITLLYPMVKAQCTKEVKESIEKIGLQHPITIIKTTRELWAIEKRDKYNFILDPPDISGEFYQIRFGHNRVAAYLELGYTKIDAIVCENAEDAADIGRSQALWMKQKIGPL